MLKNSFYISLKENMKRRVWPFALFMILVLLTYPVFIALSLNNAAMYVTSKTEYYRTAADSIGFSTGSAALIVLCAVISAIQGYAYLYHKNKVDMYESQPVSRRKRFWTIYVNGILIFFIPYIIAILISGVVAQSMHAFSSIFIAYAFTGFVENLMIYFSVYNLTIVAVMLTGNVIVSILATGVLLCYEVIFRLILEGYFSSYFISYAGKLNLMTGHDFLNPMLKIYELIMIGDQNMWNVSMSAGSIIHILFAKISFILFALIVQAVVWGILAYIFYYVRPMEAAGRAIAFTKTKAPIKFFLIFFAGILGSLVFYTLAESDLKFGIWGLIIGVVLAQGIVEVIFEFDIRSILKQKVAFIAAAIAAVMFYLIFSMDLVGYDRYIPNADQVASSAIDIDFNNDYMHDWVDPNHDENTDSSDSWFAGDYDLLQYMQLSDSTQVLALAKDGMGNDISDTYSNDNSEIAFNCTVRYNLKSGKTIYRVFPISIEQESNELNQLFANAEYKTGTQQFSQRAMQEFIAQASPSYSNGITETSYFASSATEIMSAYEKDYNEMTFDQAKSEVPCGIIKLNYNTASQTMGYTSFPVFPSYENTIAYLNKYHVFLSKTEDTDSIQNIDLVYYKPDNSTEEDEQDLSVMKMEVAQPDEYLTNVDSSNPSANYSDPEQVSEIMDHLYDSTLLNWSYVDGGAYAIDVHIVGTNDTEGYAHNWSNQSLYFVQGQIPDFVAKDLQYQLQK